MLRTAEQALASPLAHSRCCFEFVCVVWCGVLGAFKSFYPQYPGSVSACPVIHLFFGWRCHLPFRHGVLTRYAFYQSRALIFPLIS